MRDYIKKLLGRIVFLCFLQKKGYLDGRADYLAQLFNKAGSAQENFLEKVLEPLFFNILNTRKDRRDKRLLRYGNIPYLNGGLFEADDSDKLTITLPAYFWSNEAHFDDARDFKGEVTEYPYNKSWGLFDFLSRYNFTIDEGDTSDKEVGIDPEMLGKIFENLLEENKDKGTFYTPQEIVQYMARESILAFLTNDDDEKTLERLRTFVYDKNIDIFTYKKQQELLEKLTNIKICDPAVGSGAFPMGVLNELFALRKALEDKKSDVQIKKDIVKNNIYGVDIEKGAVDIARLRFWLSIIVDEETGIEPPPLPNLDYKIMRGNSLIESYKGLDLSAIGQEDNDLLFKAEQKTLDELHSKIEENYFPHTVEEKATIRADIKRLVNEILKARGFAQDKSTVKELSNLDLHDTDEFFLWHTWFSDIFAEGGFDVIIGNPPYKFLSGKDNPVKKLQKEGQITKAEKLQSLLDRYTNSHPMSSKGCKDFYKWFIDASFTFLKQNGALSLVTPNTYITLDRFLDIRTILLENNSTLLFVDLGFGIFEKPIVPSAIFIAKKGITHNKKNTISYCDLKGVDKITLRSALSYLVKKYTKTFAIKDNNLCLYKTSLASKLYLNFPTTIKTILSISEGEHSLKITERFTKSNQKPNLLRIIDDKKITKWGLAPIAFVPCDNCKKYSASLHSGSRCFLRKTGDSILVAATKDKKLAVICQNAYVCHTINSSMSINFIISLLNSKLLTYLYQNGPFGQKDRIMAQFRIYGLYTLPIPEITKADQKALSTLAQKILDAKASNPNADTSALEAKIDAKVYKLYGLTKEEIATIEGE